MIKKIIKEIPYSLKIKRAVYGKLSDASLKQNVVMLHTGRSGSQVLGNMLNERKDFHWAGEIFEPHMAKKLSVKDFNKEVSNERRKKIAANFGFEVKRLDQLHMNPNCLNMKPQELVVELQKLINIKFILLERKNYLRRAISAQLGRDKKTWHSVKKSNSLSKTFIDIEKFETGIKKQPLLELFESMEENFQIFKQILPNNALLITYEDDILQDPRKAYHKICDYVGVNLDNVTPKLKRTNPFEVHQLISNYDEVKDLLVGTKFEWMLFD